MTARSFCIAALVVIAGCKPRTAPTTEAHADAAPAPSMRVFVLDASAAMASASKPAPDAGLPEPFSDLFDYGEVDAGQGDPAKLAQPTYDTYGNSRFHFTVDFPKSFTPMPEPENGDGMQWRVGRLVAINASAGYGLDLPLTCPSGPEVTAHRTGKTTCWSTGKRDGYIFWTRRTRQGDTDYTLAFEYAESVKEAMDPIVKHVAASQSP